jgi:CMP-2-keto-3-deoxyoctulosonic acid synthetase
MIVVGYGTAAEDRIEGLEQLRALRELIKIYGKSHRFTRGLGSDQADSFI